jgi:hypothetical protein
MWCTGAGPLNLGSRYTLKFTLLHVMQPTPYMLSSPLLQVLRQTGFLEPQNTDNMFSDHNTGSTPPRHAQLATSVS